MTDLHADARPVATGAAARLFDRVVVTLDGSALAEAALDEATALARIFGSGLHLLRVIDLGRLEQYGAFGLGMEYTALDLAVQDERIAARATSRTSSCGWLETACLLPLNCEKGSPRGRSSLACSPATSW